MHKSTDDKPKPKLHTGFDPRPTDPKSSAFVQENEWVIPMIELDDGTVIVGDDYVPAITENVEVPA